MIDKEKRKLFVAYLEKLIENKANEDDWFSYIIEHYLDEELEEVRRNIVRLRIKAGDPKVFPLTEEHRIHLREWAIALS